MSNQMMTTDDHELPQQPNEQEIDNFRQKAAGFLSRPENLKKIKDMVGKGNRLTLNIDDIRRSDPGLASFILKSPLAAIRVFEENLNAQASQFTGNDQKGGEKQAQSLDAQFPKKVQIYYINFEGNMGQNFVTPRGLKSTLLNELVQVQGIVTRMSIVKPKIQTSVHYCEATKKGHIKHYTD